MTKARNIADLLDATGDVVSTALDNVPPSDNASSLTTGTLPVARLADGSITNAKLDNDAKVVKSASAPSSPNEGDLWYDTGNEILKIYSNSDNDFVKVVRVIPTLDSISGSIFNATTGNLTLTGSGFLSSNLIVSFTPSGGSASTVTVTPTNDTTATVAIPSAIYGQSANTVISISVQNSDLKSSNSSNKTVIDLPSGGTITTSGGYRYHKFSSSGTFTNTFSQQVEYLAVAGGGGGGRSGFGGGAGSGGLLKNTSSTLSATTYSIVIGAGGGAYSNGADTTGLGITAIGGGKGGTYGQNGTDGGSGGGGGGDVTTSGGSGTAGQGNDGGQGLDPSPEVAAGGGGAGAVGGNGTASGAGAGGVGLQYSDFATATSTGDSGYYAGGGGGGVGRNDILNASTPASGGTGGGGSGGLSNYANTGYPSASPVAGSANTGGGGGGGSATSSSDAGSSGGASGGSGIFIIRYQL
jgi:hypothetical protein